MQELFEWSQIYICCEADDIVIIIALSNLGMSQHPSDGLVDLKHFYNAS